MKKWLVLAALMAVAAELPSGAVKYESGKHTQRIAVTDGRDTIEWVLVTDMPDKKWMQSGGLEGISGWKSEKYRTLPSPAKYRVGDISVLNSLGYYQNNRGVIRTYPDGTRFDDVLSTPKGIFEHRVREKVDGKWRSRIIEENVANRPQGYTGLTVSCASCHNKAGTGGYAAGLVPGGDTVLSDKMFWEKLE